MKRIKILLLLLYVLMLTGCNIKSDENNKTVYGFINIDFPTSITREIEIPIEQKYVFKDFQKKYTEDGGISIVLNFENTNIE